MAKYFNIDCGFFPTNIKLCFDKKAFHKILKDHDADKNGWLNNEERKAAREALKKKYQPEPEEGTE